MSQLCNGALLQQLLEDSAQEPDPMEETPTDNSMPILSNWEWMETKEEPKKGGMPIHDICNVLYDLTGGWPKRVDNVLFVPGENLKPRYLETSAQLFAWLDAQALIDWGKSSDMISQERFMAHLEETAERFDALEVYPHFPRLPNTYYLHPALPNTDGRHLNAFVDFFRPLTDVDRDLILAYIMSLAWGGRPGSRPAWLIVGPDDDPEQGRGLGKSKLAELGSELVGGFFEISHKEDIIAVKKRLLSPAARTTRVARLDNQKTYRFSWDDLEGLITSPVISGHRMYKGEGRRPNTLTWVLTLNGASLSKDMAQRVMTVKLARPEYDPRWEDEVRAYIESNRWRIFADIRSRLEQ